MICKYSMASLSAIFALEDTGIHVGITDGSNMTANVEAFIDKYFCI